MKKKNRKKLFAWIDKESSLIDTFLIIANIVILILQIIFWR